MRRNARASLRRHHADSPVSSRPRFAPNYDFDVVIQGSKQVDQAFDGKPCELVVPNSGNLRLRDTEYCGGISLGEPAAIENLVQHIRQTKLSLALTSIRKSEIREHIPCA